MLFIQSKYQRVDKNNTSQKEYSISLYIDHFVTEKLSHSL